MSAVAQGSLLLVTHGVAGRPGVALAHAIRDFATALIQWVAQEDDLLAAGRPVNGFTKVILTEAQKERLVRQGIVFPSLAVLLPLPWAALRLRRG